MQIKKELERTNLYQNECSKSKLFILSDILENNWYFVLVIIIGYFLLYTKKVNTEAEVMFFIIFVIFAVFFKLFGYYSHYSGEMYIMDITITDKKKSFKRNIGRFYSCCEGTETIFCTKNVYQQLNLNAKYRCFVKGNVVLDVIKKI